MVTEHAHEPGGTPPEPRPPAVGPPLVIDHYLPRYDFVVAHAAILRAPPEVCYEAARRVDILRHPVIRLLLDLRSVPGRFFGRSGARPQMGPPEAPLQTFRLDDMTGPPISWLLLGEEPNVELCLGQISRPWKLRDPAGTPSIDPAGFANFDRPGFAKVALSLRVAPYGAASTILTLETRVALTDPRSLRRFARYWTVIGPFSSLLRWIAMRRVAAELRSRAM